MSDSDQDDEFIEEALERLCSASVASSHEDHDQVREYIYVHEFQLALDLLAHIQLQAKTLPSPETRHLFETLAVMLGMRDGDMWRGVAQIRKG